MRYLILLLILISVVFSFAIDWVVIGGDPNNPEPFEEEMYDPPYDPYLIELNHNNNGHKIVCDAQNRAHIVWVKHDPRVNELNAQIRYCIVSNSTTNPEFEIDTVHEGRYMFNPVIDYGEVNGQEYVFIAWEGTADINEPSNIYFKWSYDGTWSSVYRISPTQYYQGAPCIDVPEQQLGPYIKVNIAWEDFRHGDVINNGEIYYKTVHIQGTSLSSIGVEQRVSNDDANSIKPEVKEDGSGNIHFVYTDTRRKSEDSKGYSRNFRPVYRRKDSQQGWTDEEIIEFGEPHAYRNFLYPNLVFFPTTTGEYDGFLIVSYNAWYVYGFCDGWIQEYDGELGCWGDGKHRGFNRPEEDEAEDKHKIMSPNIEYNYVEDIVYITGDTIYGCKKDDDGNIIKTWPSGVFFNCFDPDDFPDIPDWEISEEYIGPTYHEFSEQVKTNSAYSDFTIDDNGWLHVVWNEITYYVENETYSLGVYYCKGNPIGGKISQDEMSSLNKDKEDSLADDSGEYLTELNEKELVLVKPTDSVSDYDPVKELPQTHSRYLQSDDSSLTGSISSPSGVNKLSDVDDVKLTDISSSESLYISSDKSLEKSISVYPNPCDDRVSVSLSENTSNEMKVSLYDLTGRLISEVETDDGGVVSFHTSELSDGIYFIKIDDDENQEVRKVVVCH